MDFQCAWATRISAAVLICVSSTLLWLPPASADDRSCTDAERTRANKWLFLNAGDRKASLEKHLPWGAPKSRDAAAQEVLLVHWDYVIQYDENLRVPLWVAYRLDARGLNRTPDRVNCFRQDPRVDSPHAALPADYDEPQFDQGHLAPSEDMSRNLNQNINSFIMSNMAPQYGNFNRVIWKRLETQVRTWAKTRKTVYVISGSIFDHDSDGKPDAPSVAKRMKSRSGTKRVAIPTHFYKIVLHKCRDGSVETVAFILPHDKVTRTGAAGQKYLEKRVTSIADIEAVSGWQFLPTLAAIEKLDRTHMHGFWQLQPTCAR